LTTPTPTTTNYSARFLSKLKSFLQMGLTPDAMAWGVAVGLVVGIFPIFGLTTLVAAIVALIFRLNMPLVQGVNYLMTPFHVLMIIPWIRIGCWIFGWPGGHLTPAEILKHFTHDGWSAVIILWEITMRAVGAWCLMLPVALPLLYLALRPVFQRWAAETS
jgi:hypothetical protein